MIKKVKLFEFNQKKLSYLKNNKWEKHTIAPSLPILFSEKSKWNLVIRWLDEIAEIISLIISPLNFISAIRSLF